jgi:hypothetical protein
MSDMWARIAEHLADRVTGPMHFRVFLQPAMATVFAVIDGLKDAKSGAPPYFWSLLTEPAERGAMLKSGWKSVGKIFLLAVVLDVVYQVIEQRFVYPGEVMLVAIVLAIIPYLLIRGLVTRLALKPHPAPGR